MFCIVFHQSQLSFIAGIFVVILFAIVMCILTFKQICCIVFECSDFNTLLVFAAQHQLTSIMFCRFCGETVSLEDKFCAKCSGQLEIHRETGRMFQCWFSIQLSGLSRATAGLGYLTFSPGPQTFSQGPSGEKIFEFFFSKWYILAYFSNFWLTVGLPKRCGARGS